MVTKAVFLDRDGVINANVERDGMPVAPTRLEDFRYLPGVQAAVGALKAAGFKLVVITNQPDLATGRVTSSIVDAMHDKIRSELGVDDIRVCVHLDKDNCHCRKPKPGMILDAARDLGIDVKSSYLVGDRWKDVAAGHAAGCFSLFVDRGHAQDGPMRPDKIIGSLAEAAAFILAREASGGAEMRAPSVQDLKIKIFADGADIEAMRQAAANPLIKGFTTNPTLMRAAGVEDYKSFALSVLKEITDRPISFEVFSDDFASMENQALEIASWGENVYVKIPVTNTKGEFSGPLISKLSRAGVRLNVTAITTLEQVERVGEALAENQPAVVSVFAGRIADTGRDPVPHMAEALRLLKGRPRAELLWASPREVLNIFQADAIGCHIITVTNDHLKKLSLVGKDLGEYSLETVMMFHNDAAKAEYHIPISGRRAAS